MTREGTSSSRGEGPAARRVMVILPTEQDRFELDPLAAEGYALDYVEDERWRTVQPVADDFDGAAFTAECIVRASEGGADGVFYSGDFAGLVASAVAEYTGVPGPSIEASFLASHKLHGRMAEPDPIRFAGYAIGSEDWRGHPEFPCHVKPPSLCFSVLQSAVRDQEELARVVEGIAAGAPRWERPFNEFYRGYVDTIRYPWAGRDVFLVEELVQAASQHAVEGWADAEGRLHVWALSDNNYFPGPGAALDNNSVPTRLAPALIRPLCDAALDVVKAFGIRNGFWNVEVWVLPDGSFRVTEVNARIISSMTPLYRYCFGMTQYPAALRLACGQPVDEERQVPRSLHCVGGMFALRTSRTGRMGDLFRFDEIPSVAAMDGVIQLATHFDEDQDVSWTQAGGGFCIGRAWIIGGDYDEICARAAEIRARLIAE